MNQAPGKKRKAAAMPPATGNGNGQEWVNRRATEQATRAANARQVSGRRRFVDPTTCERQYSPSELEFMQAMQDYKQRSGRMFPTWSEVLEVLRGLGYEKDCNPGLAAAMPTAMDPTPSPSRSASPDKASASRPANHA
jgi:hypothetical protein